MAVILFTITAYCLVVTIACPEGSIATESTWHALRLSSYWLVLGYQLAQVFAYTVLYIWLSRYIRNNLRKSGLIHSEEL